MSSGESALRLPSRMKLQRHERRRLPEQRGAEEQLSQSEASVEELRGRLEEELKACSRRCSELESRLEERISFLEALELTSQRLGSEKSSVQGELQQVRSREEQLLRQVTQMKEELGNLQTASNGVLQKQKRLQAREQRVDVLKMELESLQEDSRFQAQGLSKATAGLDLLKMDRARLIQDLKDQAMAVDTLQLELDGVFEELDRRRSAKEALQEALKQEQTLTSLLQSALDGDKEEVHGVGQENGTYAQLVDQLSNQIVEMEEEISTLRDHLRELSAQLNDTADLVLDLRRQLNSKTSELDLLRAEVAELSRRDEDQHRKDLDVSRRQVLQLQKNLLESQNQLRTAEQDFEQEKRTMMQKLMELEKLVLDLEEVMDLASPHRFVEHEIQSMDLLMTNCIRHSRLALTLQTRCSSLPSASNEP